MLIVLVGARGAGKTTLLGALRAGGIEVLQPSTTRAPRSAADDEYDFVGEWDDSLYAWGIPVASDTYGMRRAELEKAATGVCVTVFEPLNLQVFERARSGLGVQAMTVGLDTVRDVAEQHARVAGDPKRLMDEASLRRVGEIVAECDVVLTGDAAAVADAMVAMVAVLRGRGGLLTRERLAPLIRAGALVAGADESGIRPASYDLRVGPEILCQGRIVTLDEANPRFEIPAYSYAVVGALEQASLPPFVAGRFDLKVSYFFEGVILSNGPQVDPGYKGALFCMLYNGSGRPKLLTLGKQFATLDFTTTTDTTAGYREKYQLKQRMAQFVTDGAVTGKGGAIVELVDEKVAAVNRKVKRINRNFWTVAGAVIALGVLAPVLIIPVAWIEIANVRAERLALEDAQRREAILLAEARRERAETSALLSRAQAALPTQRRLPPADGAAGVGRQR